jgi:hypothetical protein
MKPHTHTISSLIGNQRRTNGGSALLITLIFAMIITFGLAGLLPMMLSDWKMNSRTSAQEAAFSLAESGVDEAIWAVLEFNDNADAWTNAGWQESANKKYWYREWDLSDISAVLGDTYTLDEGRTGVFRVIVQKADSSSVNIISQGVVAGGNNVAQDFTVARYIESQFTRPNPFAYGLISVEDLTLNGQHSLSSFNSSDLGWNSGDSSSLGSNITVGSLSTDSADVSIGNAHIYGDLVTGSGDNGTDNMADNASLTGDIIYDYEMDLPETETPDTSGAGWFSRLPNLGFITYLNNQQIL